MAFTVDSILILLEGEKYKLYSNGSPTITEPSSLSDAKPNSITWLKPSKANEVNAALLKAGVLVCDEESYAIVKNETTSFLVVTDPKRVFSKIVSNLFVKSFEPQIHPTAFVHPEAKIGNGCYIGPFSYIGKCTIGDNLVLHGNCHIYENVRIGDNVIIHAGVVIGSDGFGYSKDVSGKVEKFPHLGGVVIGNQVEVGANTCIDKGALSNTIIEDGVKIDNLVHVAHNVIIRENAFVIANSMIGGSTEIGNGAWIAPSVSILQQLSIGQDAIIGVGSVVTKNIPSGETWAGSPARPLDDFLAIQRKMKEGL